MRSTLPLQFSGTCAPVTLILPVTVYENFPDTSTPLLPPNRPKRSVVDDIAETDPTYIDAIGVPRGVPTEYKLVDQVAAGFESIICWWCTINKNVDRINYVHYNVQRLANYTRDGFMAVHEQLSATSLMAFQNRIAVDMLLAERGGVCSLFGDQCCTFIPNNTAADGKLSRAVNGLRSLSNRLKRQSGVDTSLWDSWLDIFGKYKSIIASLFLSILVSVVLIVLCGCCCIPCARSLLSRMVNVALGDKLAVQMASRPITSFDARELGDGDDRPLITVPSGDDEQVVPAQNGDDYSWLFPSDESEYRRQVEASLLGKAPGTYSYVWTQGELFCLNDILDPVDSDDSDDAVSL